MTKNEALQIAIDFLHGSYATHSVRKACQEALEQLAWQGLTDDELKVLTLLKKVDNLDDVGFAKMIEQVLKEKNCENDNPR
jgi:hypothetical protein